MNIDNELAFGEYVSIPIRTEKTAEQKWIELREYLNDALESTHKILKECKETELIDDAYWLQEICDTLFEIILKMNILDT